MAISTLSAQTNDTYSTAVGDIVAGAVKGGVKAWKENLTA